ncbi:hypothetical protein [uncultured Cohaesibacter sp.]|uniref:hypothetical protein n=1 Tax=uncultured Cohaesibacter sp. TaxID=1002546 RepID=UPI0029300C13|nr:hypothetical protein [uncultured Cohaesibacter sp.]
MPSQPPEEVAPSLEEEQSQDDIDALFDSPSGGEEQSQDDIDALFDSPSGGEEQSQDDIDALFDSPSGGGEEQSQDDIDALFDSPSGGGEEQSQDDIDALFDSPSGGEDQSQDDIDALFDSPSGGGEEQNQDDIDALFDSPSAGGKEQSQDDVDAMFDTAPAKTEEADKVSGSEAEPQTGRETESPFVIKGDGGADFQPPVVDLIDAAAFEAQKVAARGTDIESRANRRRRLRGKRKGRKASGPRQREASDKREWMRGGAALGSTLVILAGLFLAPTFWVRHFPDLASFFSMFGMNVNVVGVNIDLVDARIQQRDGSPVLSIDTELVNPGTEPVILPSIEFSVLGNDREELYSWVIGPDNVGLGPGERKQIETSIAAPAKAKYLSLRVFNE